MGGTPFEGNGYKANIVKSSPLSGTISFFKGYMDAIIKNPYLIANYNSIIIQAYEFFYQKYWSKKYQTKNGIVKISPFHEYIKWNEREINNTVMKIGWEQNPNLDSMWRGDCIIGPIRQYLYKNQLGYNDFDDHIWSLIRDGQIARDEGVRRINNKKENLKTIKFYLNRIGIKEETLNIL